MKKALIAHFSQGGSTARVASHIAQGLKQGNCSVDIHLIQSNKPVDITGYDCIGIGFPAYSFRVPFIVEQFIQSLPDLQGKPFFIFMQYGSKPGKAGTDARKSMERKGGREIGYSRYCGTDYYIGFIREGILFSPDDPTTQALGDAEKFGKGLVAIMDGGNYTRPPYEGGAGVVFTLERVMMNRRLVNYFYRFFYRVNRKSCNQCGICVKNCPTGNILMDEKGFPRFSGNCISCWYCELYCPKEAISTPLDWPIMTPFNNYNIRQILKDSAIGRASVKLANGKIQRM